jgi:K+-sensing histidine kinase KdpD
MFRDARDRKRAELQALEVARAESARTDAETTLQQNNELLSSGLRTLSEPLTRLYRSAVRLARYANEAEARRVSALARVVEARARAVQGTMQHLADAAAIQAASLQLRAERVNLVPLVSRAVASARARSKVHKINVGLPQGLTVLVDPVRFEQVLDALIDQAMRRNPRGCWIDVDLRRPLVGLARLEVRDYGRAVSEPEQRELLETNGPKHGLAVSRWIVEQHGGSLSMESPTEGGLRIIVALPTQRGRVLAG